MVSQSFSYNDTETTYSVCHAVQSAEEGFESADLSYQIVSLLEKTLVKDWTLAGNIDHPIKNNIFHRVWNRWVIHPRSVKVITESSNVDLLHITDQEQAHLVPKNSKIPVAVTVHDLFHISPRKIILDKKRLSLDPNSFRFLNNNATSTSAGRLFIKTNSSRAGTYS